MVFFQQKQKRMPVLCISGVCHFKAKHHKNTCVVLDTKLQQLLQYAACFKMLFAIQLPLLTIFFLPSNLISQTKLIFVKKVSLHSNVNVCHVDLYLSLFMGLLYTAFFLYTTGDCWMTTILCFYFLIKIKTILWVKLHLRWYLPNHQ